ncbi:MAG TPA: ATP-binding protein [Acidimicrobiales bacterium]|nr:ATP-binding protein [Acidimicrobiales bacterium]
MSEREPALLIVDDVSENLVAVSAALAPLGHRILRARSGEEALRHLLTDDVGVIVLDVQMPGIDGFETARHIKDRDSTSDIPIVFLTALGGDVEHRLRGYDAGAVDYLAKPVDPDILRAKVRVFLELHLATEELRTQGELLALRTKELERSNADLEQFSYVASHDLQEPLRVLAGYLELLTDHLGDELGDEARGWVDRAGAAAGRMSSMISDLLTYARAGAGGGEREAVALDDAVATALRSLEASLRDSGGTVDAPDGLGTVLAVRLDVERILQNLIGNALKHRGDGPPHIALDARRTDDDAIEVSVCDDGRGVDEADLERVFGRFERVGGEPYPGTGLGLAVCRRLVDRAGGRIWMERNAPADGVTVRFTLPAAP